MAGSSRSAVAAVAKTCRRRWRGRVLPGPMSGTATTTWPRKLKRARPDAGSGRRAHSRPGTTVPTAGAGQRLQRRMAARSGQHQPEGHPDLPHPLVGQLCQNPGSTFRKASAGFATRQEPKPRAGGRRGRADQSPGKDRGARASPAHRVAPPRGRSASPAGRSRHRPPAGARSRPAPRRAGTADRPGSSSARFGRSSSVLLWLAPGRVGNPQRVTETKRTCAAGLIVPPGQPALTRRTRGIWRAASLRAWLAA